MGGQWTHGPIGLEAEDTSSPLAQRTVLVVVHYVAAGTRLMDVVPVLESDFRVQVVFTCGPGTIGHGVDELLASIDGLVMPWEQAVHTRFDLAIAASYEGLQHLRAPVVVLSHGADNNKYAKRLAGRLPSERLPFGFGPQWLVRDASVVPSAIALAHYSHLALLADSCPEALPAAVVVGDPCLDRLMASWPWRDAYRRAFGVGGGRRLVVVSSTHGPSGLLEACPDLPARLMARLPVDRWQVAMVLHPQIWYWHGPWQVKAWLAEARRAGMLLEPPPLSWRFLIMV